MNAISIGDALFTKTQKKVIGLLFGKPDKSFYTNEIIRLVSIGRGTVSRELERLVGAGLLTLTKTGNQKRYQANPECPIYDELISIVEKTLDEKDGAELSLVFSDARLKKLAQQYHIHRLVLFGSAARRQITPESDIDLLVEFEPGEAPSLGGMVKMSDAFSALFGGRKIDIVTPSILNNPYRRKAIEKDMEELYAA